MSNIWDVAGKQVTSTLFVPDIADSGRLFVRNLPFNVTEADIRSLFSPFGDLSEVIFALFLLSNS